MNPVYSFQWLCQSMQQRQIVTIMLHSGKTINGIINGLSAEDGSGRHWLIKMNNEENSYYVRAE